MLHIRSSVGVGDEQVPGLALAAPSPSPVRSGATIAFTLPDDATGAAARLAVFGVDGRRVRALAAGVMSPGRHELSWDATDERGARVPAGVYFLSLEWNGHALTRRVPVIP
jgi:flagellar hook assembly protein FlgD